VPSIRLGRYNQGFDRLLPLHGFEGLLALLDRETVGDGLGHRKVGVMRLGNPASRPMLCVLKLATWAAQQEPGPEEEAWEEEE